MSLPEIFALSICASFPVFAFLAWYFSHRARHKERLLMIEKNMNLNDITSPARRANGKLLYKAGVVTLGLGIGFLVITLFSAIGLRDFINADPTVLAILLISGSGALLIAEKRVQRKEE